VLGPSSCGLCQLGFWNPDKDNAGNVTSALLVGSYHPHRLAHRCLCFALVSLQYFWAFGCSCYTALKTRGPPAVGSSLLARGGAVTSVVRQPKPQIPPQSSKSPACRTQPISRGNPGSNELQFASPVSEVLQTDCNRKCIPVAVSEFKQPVTSLHLRRSAWKNSKTGIAAAPTWQAI
jgi:hypothetical protein